MQRRSWQLRGRAWRQGWPRLVLAFALAAGLEWCAPGRAGAANFTATLDRDTVPVGESATLTLSFEGGQPRSIPVPPQVPNLQITDTGSSTSWQQVGDQVSLTVSRTFALTPTQPGEYTIPSLRAEVDGQAFTNPPLKLLAVKAEAPTANAGGERLAFLKLLVPKKEAFVGEVFTVQLQLYLRNGVANAQQVLQYFDGLGGSALKAEGFSVLKAAHAQWRRTQVGNAAFNVATLVIALTPVKTGELNIVGAVDATLPLQIPVQRRRDGFFDPFNMFQQTEERRVTLPAESEKLAALPLPKENVPPSFNGAVGSYSMSVSVGPTNVAIGDPVTVRVQLSGRGALDALALPEQKAWRDFKTYPATAKVDTTDPLGLQGTKTFEQVVVPQNAEIKELPPVSFSFFDPDQKSYRTLTQPAVALVVRPSASAPPPTVASARTGQDNPPPAQDIVPIKQSLGTVAHASPPLLLQTWFLGLQGVPLLAWLSAVVWRKRTESLANNPRLRRQRQVAQIVREGLVQLRRLAEEKRSEEFFATLVRLLQEQLGERLDLPASAITEAVIEEHLRPRGVPDAVLTPLHELFQTCNLARYAPVKSSQELAAIVPEVEAALRAVATLNGLKR